MAIAPSSFLNQFLNTNRPERIPEFKANSLFSPQLRQRGSEKKRADHLADCLFAFVQFACVHDQSSPAGLWFVSILMTGILLDCGMPVNPEFEIVILNP